MDFGQQLTVDERPLLPAIRACTAETKELISALASSETAATRAAVIFALAQQQALSQAKDQLLSLLDDDSVAARAASWALGQIDAESELLHVATSGRLDARENAYRALAHRAATGLASATLADGLLTCIDSELERVAGGRTGLAEKACVALAVLGDARCDAQVERVLNADRFCDRFELQRIRKIMADQGVDNETRDELSTDWPILFDEELADLSSEADATAEESVNPTDSVETETETEAEDELAEPDEDMPAVSGDRIDWTGFVDSDEAAALDEQSSTIISQLGPVLEQLAERALGKTLLACEAQEVAVLLLQVLPQALPPQYVQVALAPQGLTAIKAVLSYQERLQPDSTADVAEGLELVREQIKAQMRASGNLNSTIYDDPDASPLA
jgi:hypothetical protein